MITFPERAKVGKIVAKEYFYKNIDAATKNLFQSEIARIIWEYKLAPNTINLPIKKWAEVEVFRIVLKNGEIPEETVKEIAKLNPLTAAFKDSSFKDSAEKINLSEHFRIISPDTRVKVI